MMDKMNGMFSWREGDCEDRSMKGKRKKKGGYKGKRQKMGSDACLGNDSKEDSMTKKKQNKTISKSKSKSGRTLLYCFRADRCRGTEMNIQLDRVKGCRLPSLAI